MSISARLKDLLEANDVEHQVIEHEPAYTAQEEAAAAHVPGHTWAKTVVMVADGEPQLAVLPATHRVVEERFRQLVGATEVRLADEEEFTALYPDCEPGAMPPVGALYEQTTFVDEALRRAERIAFDAGDHETAVEIAYADYEKLTSPIPGEFAERIED